MIRVLIANHPRMLGEIAEKFIRRQSDMEVVSGTSQASGVTPSRAAELGAHVVVITADSSPLETAAAYLDTNPHLTVVCVSEDGRSGRCYFVDSDGVGTRGNRNSIRFEPLNELGGKPLIDAVRRSFRAR